MPAAGGQSPNDGVGATPNEAVTASWAPGWYPDPQRVADERYWDGRARTQNVREVRLRTPEERTDLLERRIRTETAQGWRLKLLGTTRQRSLGASR